MLPAAIERIRRCKIAITDDDNWQMVSILNVVLTDGLPAVGAACTKRSAAFIPPDVGPQHPGSSTRTCSTVRHHDQRP